MWLPLTYLQIFSFSEKTTRATVSFDFNTVAWFAYLKYTILYGPVVMKCKYELLPLKYVNLANLYLGTVRWIASLVSWRISRWCYTPASFCILVLDLEFWLDPWLCLFSNKRVGLLSLALCCVVYVVARYSLHATQKWLTTKLQPTDAVEEELYIQGSTMVRFQCTLLDRLSCCTICCLSCCTI